MALAGDRGCPIVPAGATAGRRVGLLAFALLGSSVVLPSLIGLLSVEITRDLEFGDLGLGAAISAFWVVTAVAAPLAGRWVDRRGWRLGALLGAFLAGGALMVCAVAVTSWVGLLLVLAVAGLGYGFASPTSNIAVVSSVPRRMTATVLGFKQTAPPLLMAAAGVVAPVVAGRFGWRPALGLGLVLPVAVLLGLWLVGSGRSEGRPERSGRASPHRRPPECPTTPPLRTTPVMLAAGLGTFSVASMTGFAVLTLVSVGLSSTTAAGVVAAGSMAAVVARVVSGRLLDPRPLNDVRPLVAVMVVAAGALLLISFGIFAVDGGGGRGREVAGLAVVVGVLLGLVAAWTWPALLLLMVVRASSSPGASSGLIQLGSGVGSAAGPLAFGLLSAAGGRGWGWFAMGATTVAALLLVRAAQRVDPIATKRDTLTIL